MSDQDPYAGAPGAPQPPAEQPFYPPPPGFAPPPADPHAAPPMTHGAPLQPPPTKRRVWPVILVAVLVLVCLPAVCLGTFAVTAARESAKTSKAVGLAETHYGSSAAALEEASSALEKLEEGEGDPSAVGDAQAKLRTARDEIAAARVAIEGLDDSEGKTAYLGSLDSATEALEGVERMLGTVAVLTRLSDQVKAGTKALKDGNRLLDEAVKAGNSGKYSRMRDRASAASARYAIVIAVLTAAHKAEPSAGLDDLVAYVRIRKKHADLAVRMAADGSAGRRAAYNKKVDEAERLEAEADTIANPAIIDDPDWFEKRVAKDQELFEKAAARADESRTRALAAFGYEDR